jgi:hypothetical protein
VVDFSNFRVITKEEESKLLPPKKHKKTMTNHVEMSKCVGCSISMGKNVEK